VAFGDMEQLRRGAGLPVTIRVRGDARAIAKKLDGSFLKTIEPNGESIDIDCRAEDKMSLLRLLAGLGESCADLEIRPPSLDDLYLYYSGRGLSAGNAGPVSR
jgi:Cu-processing system ATP-binding protein